LRTRVREGRLQTTLIGVQVPEMLGH
jgi:hypothetical protein